MSRVRYIGSKARIAADILEVAGTPNAGRLVDLFSGTGVVSREAAVRGWRVHANDHLLSASVATHAQLLNDGRVPFDDLGGYESAISQLNSSPEIQGYFFREYSPSGESHSGEERQYFTIGNACRIDGIRRRIREWHAQGAVSSDEHALLLADLMAACNRVANIAGTYGCFLRRWTTGSQRQLRMAPRQLLRHPTQFSVSTLDAVSVPTRTADVLYLDPPYTKRQYASYYHILETIAHEDEPEVEGVSGLRPWQHRASEFCYKRRALPALVRICEGSPAKRILISYNSEGHIHLDDMYAALRKLGDVVVHELATIGRYRPNKAATSNGSAVTEYLIELATRQLDTSAVGRLETRTAALPLWHSKSED